MSDTPTKQEVRDYVGQNGLNIDADAFFNFFSNNNWMICGHKMDQWKDYLKTCEKKGKFQPSTTGPIRNKHISYDEPSGKGFYDRNGWYYEIINGQMYYKADPNKPLQAGDEIYLQEIPQRIQKMK